MSDIGIDKVFAGSIPEIYDTLLVPLIFEPYAADLARRLAEQRLHRILEIAAGTGVVTRAMARALAPTGRRRSAKRAACFTQRLGEATDTAAEALARRFGRGAIDAKNQAHVIAVET